jgi:hypothetical protein
MFLNPALGSTVFVFLSIFGLVGVCNSVCSTRWRL